MANYPSLPWSRDSTRVPHAGIALDVAEDGTVRGRTLYASPYYEITAVHPGISSAERSSLESHFASHVGVSFTLVWPWGDESHTVYYAEAPELQSVGSVHTATVRLVGRPA